MKPPRAFTLVELLVTIGVIGLLVAILLPTIGRARRSADSSACLSNLRGWSQAFSMYHTDHRGRYPIDWGNHPPAGSGQGTWMRVMSQYYQNLDRFRLCPSADQPLGSFGSPTFAAWGPIPASQGFLFDPNDAGSYGINHWINDLPRSGPFVNGWRGRPDLQWRRVGGHRGKPSNAPLIGDCEWYGGSPFDLASGLTFGAVPAVENALFKRYYGSNLWLYDMARFAMNRHGKGINMAFEDGSVRFVTKPELWTLHWYRGFRPAKVTLPF
ncbi:MAG: prepilin-type N-terminal cleavage/methylation domain-containing protein [Phycisphaerae bacterium]|nr:prepilin-type N-terminal cleavage/methylation domain-containing protein [Phycisphaerae bacterium]MDW8261209.1 type II secretion system protein [Phycisphaerales bacterium]